MPERRSRGREEPRCDWRGKFSALQSLEKSQNAEGISIRVGSCAAVSEEAATVVDLSSRGVAVADAAREADGTTESPANGAATP
jgi:hypothetical protein